MKTINELFVTVPKTIVAADLHMDLRTLNPMIADPLKFGFQDVVKIASLLEVDEFAVITLIYNQYQIDKKNKRKVAG